LYNGESMRYYWLKLHRDFFKRHDVRIIEEMDNGKDYLLFYLKLLVESIDHEGNLRFSETIPYNDKMLATITNTNIDIVRTAIKVFQELKMLEVFDDGTLYLNQIEKMIGSETDKAKLMRRLRAKQKVTLLPDVTNCYAEIEQEKEEEKEIQQEIEKETDSYLVKSIVEYLNDKAKSQYRYQTVATKRHIVARINEGFTLDNFKTVIDKKCEEWLGTDMAKYIRPETLFGTKFEVYLNQKSEKEKPEPEKIEIPKPPKCKCGGEMEEKAIGLARCNKCKTISEFKNGEWRKK